MDIFSWLPIIIFIYAVSTIFGSQNKKPQSRRQPNNRPQGLPQSSRSTYSQRETKSTRPNWREKFEELERELFPKEVQTNQPSRTNPSRTSTVPSRYQSPTQKYYPEDAVSTEGLGREEVFSVEGVWGIEGSSGTEGSGGIEGGSPREDPLNRKGLLGTEGKKVASGMPKPGLTTSEQKLQENSVFNIAPTNPVVQGVIWAEVLGKPRAHSKFAYKRRD